MLFLKFFCNSQIVQRKFLVRSKPRQILHIIGAYTMSCKQGSKRGAYIEPRENNYCALGYARANAQPKARQPTRPKGHFIYVFLLFFILSYKEARAAGFVLFCCWIVRCIGEMRADGGGSCRGGINAARAVIPANRPNGKTAGDAYMRPLQT